LLGHFYFLAKIFINNRHVAVLNSCKVSDSDIVHILIATAEVLGQDTRNLIINRTSIRRRLQETHKYITVHLKDNFKTDSKDIVVHWDGRLLPTNKCIQNDRLSIIITFQCTE